MNSGKRTRDGEREGELRILASGTVLTPSRLSKPISQDRENEYIIKDSLVYREICKEGELVSQSNKY